MLEIVLLGLNHKTAPVELRERLAFSGDEIGQTLDSLRCSPEISEIVLFSTCNRVEVLMTAENPEVAMDSVKSYLGDLKKTPVADFEKSLYFFQGDEAVRHVFRVAASLDSMMVGEPQILGQIKESYRLAAHKKASGVMLNRLLHRTFFVAKKIRSHTGIGDHAVSISYAAIEMAKKIFGSLRGKNILMIGAGEMAELALEHLIRQKAGDIFVANRTFERGLALAGSFGGQAVKYEEVQEILMDADIIISSTGSPDYVLKKEQVKGVMPKRKNRPLFFIDIAVPRDIDPAINRLSNSYVYDIDDLKLIIEENLEDRNKEAKKAERIIDEAVIRFREWIESLDVVPTIIDLRSKMSCIADAELKKTVNSMSDLSKEDHEALGRMTEAIINKILHDPTLFLKNNGCMGNKSLNIDMARKLFKLDCK